MPFGVMFAGLVFAVLGPWYGATLAASEAGRGGVLLGTIWAAAGVATGFEVFARRGGSRAVGSLGAVILAAEGLRQVLSRGELLEHVMVVAGPAALVLLLTAPRPSAARPAPVQRRPSAAGFRPLALFAWVGVLTVAALFAWNVASETGSTAGSAPMLSAASGVPMEPDGSARPGSAGGAVSAGRVPRAVSTAPAEAATIAWATFGKGLAEAKSRQTPMFVQFYATWCGACRTMERGTFRDANVTRRLSELVAVRVNAEEPVERDGLRGTELADRFQVEAYPTLLVIDPKGRELARLVGAPAPGAFLRWLDGALSKAGGSRAGARLPADRIATN